MRPMSRPTPLLPVQGFKTYAVTKPPGTHTRPATCTEVDCKQWREGWSTPVATGADDSLLRRAAAGTVDGLRRRFTVRRDGLLVWFDFPAEQPCFKARTHRIDLQRPGLYVVRGGDWRGNTGLIRRHVNDVEWVEDFAEHQDRLAHTIGGRP